MYTRLGVAVVRWLPKRATTVISHAGHVSHCRTSTPCRPYGTDSFSHASTEERNMNTNTNGAGSCGVPESTMTAMDDDDTSALLFASLNEAPDDMRGRLQEEEEGREEEKGKEEVANMKTSSGGVTSDVVADAGELEAMLASESFEDECGILPLPEHLEESSSKEGSSLFNTKNITVNVPTSTTWIATMCTSSSYLGQQDALYLAAPTPLEARLPQPSLSSPCVMVVFAANDMRVHDNYTLALAAVRAEEAGGLPVIAVAVVDYRNFAQPSAVGGYFRQSPMRARFFLETLAELRTTVENELHIPLLIRCGRPEEHIPRLAVECGAAHVFLTTQYAPHEKRVHDNIMESIRRRWWVSRDANSGLEPKKHSAALSHPYNNNNDDGGGGGSCMGRMTTTLPGGAGTGVIEEGRESISAIPHSVWQTTLVHVDDLPVPVTSMSEGERWYHDDVTLATIRPTKPYDSYIAKLTSLPRRENLLPSMAERSGLEPPPAFRGSIPTLEQLGYGNIEAFAVEEVIATQSSHPAGERAGINRVEEWLAGGGVTSLLRYGREYRTNVKMYSQRLSRVSPYISNGSLSPRRFYEMLRSYASENIRDNFVQMQYREALLRLSRRDYWHWMGLRYGCQLFFPYGPRPEQTDNIPDWRHDEKIVQKWCAGLTGVPFADAAMRELLTTGFVAHEGRQALAWLLTRGYGQDWRLGAEWMERCSLDYDPFLCYGNFAYFTELLTDDFGEPVRNIHWLAHHHDQTGIYVKKWLPVLSKIPPVYIHRPHILTPKMQAMHGVKLGKNYPYPLKLWDGAQYTLSSSELTTYFDNSSAWHQKAKNGAGGPGYAEALRHGQAIMKVEEWSTAVSPDNILECPWARHLPASAFESGSGSGGSEGEEEEEEMQTVRVTQREDTRSRTGHQHVSLA